MKYLVALISLLASVSACELAYRMFTHRSFHLANVFDEDRELIAAAYPWRFDSKLGWAHDPALGGRRSAWEVTAHILPDGSRANGAGPKCDSDCTTLAEGSSFTFGDEVNDPETWPALLERRTGCCVKNRGVCGYGIDQAALATLQDLRELRPSFLILGVTADALITLSQSLRQGLYKPFFDEHGALREIPSSITLENWKDLVHEQQRNPGPLAYSYLVHDLAVAIQPEWQRMPNVAVKNDPQEIACALIREVQTEGTKRGTEFFLLFQYSHRLKLEEQEALSALRRCANDSSVAIIDVLPELKRSATLDELFLGDGHMSPKGNGLVAEVIYKSIPSMRAPRAREPSH